MMRMNNKRFHVSNIMFYLGLGVFVVLAAIYAACYKNNNLILKVIPALVFVFGLLIVIISMKTSKKMHQIFIGFQMVFWGLLFLLKHLNIFTYSFYQYWPIIGIVSGIFLTVAGLVKYKKVLFGYFVAALALFLMGCWFALFSFSIIKIPFKIVAVVGGPLFFIMVCIFIIGFFLMQKKYTNLIVEDDDNVSIDSDEFNTDSGDSQS